MPVSLESIIRAVCGDVIALADISCSSSHDRYSVALLSAIVVIDPNPHPLAALTAFAMHEHPPQTLRFIVWRAAPDAAVMLEQDAFASLRSALVPHLERIWNALAAPSVPDVIEACAGMATAMNAGGVSLLERIGEDGWKQTPPETRETLLQAMETDTETAAKGGGAVWAALDPDERTRIAQATSDAQSAANLLALIGAEGWALAPPEACETLLRRGIRTAMDAAVGGRAVWAALEPEDRVRVVRSAVRCDDAAYDLLERIGAEGWILAPPEARETLLQAITKKPRAAARLFGDAWARSIPMSAPTSPKSRRRPHPTPPRRGEGRGGGTPPSC